MPRLVELAVADRAFGRRRGSRGRASRREVAAAGAGVATRFEADRYEPRPRRRCSVIVTCRTAGMPGMSLVTFEHRRVVLAVRVRDDPRRHDVAGLSDVELKFAPVPAAMPPASRRANRATSRRAGLARQRTAARCMGDPFPWEEDAGRRTDAAAGGVLSTAVGELERRSMSTSSAEWSLSPCRATRGGRRGDRAQLRGAEDVVEPPAAAVACRHAQLGSRAP